MSNHLLSMSSAPSAEVVILGHSRADFDQAFAIATAAGTPPSNPTGSASAVAQSLSRIDQACASVQLQPRYFALGEAIAAQALSSQIILFCISHLSTHNLYAQIGALLSSYPACRVVPIVEYADQAQAACLLELGCVDYLLAPFSATQCAELLQRLACPRPLTQGFIGESPASRRLLAMAERVAATQAPILITGETGTGKEVLARYIHAVGGSAAAPFIAINCAAIPEAMLESLLFGHEKGAFTGAVQAQPGKFELAQNGTLLLDEIGELPLALQAKLLRVLQEKTVERLGGRREIALNVRIIAATNRDLREEVAAGRFRSDLLFRLDVLPLHIAPLRERGQDVLALACAFIERYAPEALQDCAAAALFTTDARAALAAYDWPGNVRELENMIQRALVLRKGLLIQAQDLGLPCTPVAAALDTFLDLAEPHPAPTSAPIEHSNFLPESRLPLSSNDRDSFVRAPFVGDSFISEPASSNPAVNDSAINDRAVSAPSLWADQAAQQSPFYIEMARAPATHPLTLAPSASRPEPSGANVSSTGGKATLKARGKWAEYEHVLDTIARCGGHKTKAAASLGMTTRALRYRLNAMREQGFCIPF